MLGFAISLLILVVCGKKHLAPSDYIRWVTDPANGLVKTKELSAFRFELRYLPSELTILNGISSVELTKEKVDAALAERGNVHEFQLRLASVEGTEFLRTGISEMTQYHQRLEYYTGHVQNDLKLVVGFDTLDCSLSHFERTYGVAPYNTLILAFEQESKTNDGLSLIYNDRVLGLGTVKFAIDQRDLEKIPELKL